MSAEERKPAELARRLAKRAANRAAAHKDTWRRDTYTLPSDEARIMARDYFAKFPKAAYMTEIESWRELTGGCIEFTIRRLPSAD
jgi:type IV secretory pathway VirD2 relaxase